jgi:hypothetical protein
MQMHLHLMQRKIAKQQVEEEIKAFYRGNLEQVAKYSTV